MSLRARLDREEGLTLLEMIITVLILGLAFVVILGGVTTAIVASSQHKKHAEAKTALIAFAEAVKKATFVACPVATSATYAPAAVGFTAPSGYTAAVDSVQFWNQSANTFGATCVATPPSSDAQQIALRVSANSDLTTGTLSETLTIIKRRPYAP